MGCGIGRISGWMPSRGEGEENVQEQAAHTGVIQDWWDDCHTGRHPESEFFLTGSGGPDVWASLEVAHLLEPGRWVLNIGVGQGHCTRALAARGCEVSALDISPHALDKVRPVIRAGYLATALSELPRNVFDLALSFLVAQHVSDADLSAQLVAVVNSLKVGGMFAMQFAYRPEPGEGPFDDTLRNCQVGGVCRSLSHMDRMVFEAGGEIVWARRIGLFPQYGSGWYAIHVVRRGC